MANILTNISIISYLSSDEVHEYGALSRIILSTRNSDGSIRFRGTEILISLARSPQIDSTNLQTSIESADELSKSDFYNVYPKTVISLIGLPYPHQVCPSLGWFRISGDLKAVLWNYLYENDTSEAVGRGVIGQITGDSAFRYISLYAVYNESISEGELPTIGLYTQNGEYSGITIAQNEIPFEIVTSEVIGMYFLQDIYYIVLNSDDISTSPTFVIRYTGPAQLGPYNISYATVTGQAIDDGILYKDDSYIKAGTDAVVGRYNLNVHYDGYDADLTIVVVESEDDIPKPGPYEPGGTSGTGGGNGLFGENELSDIILNDIPGGSSESDISSAGLFTRYVMSTSTTRAFGDWLFSDNIIDTIVKEFMALIFASPMEAIISMISYPFSIGSLPGVATAASNVFYGNKDSGIASLGRLTNGFATIDWGTVAIDEYWGNFLDYSPHTKIELYLPWSTGFVDIDPNDVMNSTLSIVTNIELDKGTCVHNIYNGRGAVIGQYSGVCGKQLPVTALDTSGKALAMVTSAVATVVSAGAAAAGIGAGAEAGTAAVSGASHIGASKSVKYSARIAAENVAMSKYEPIAKAGMKTAAVSALAAFRVPPHIARAGSFNGNGAGMGVQYPYFILSRPDQSVPSQYGAYVGYPSNIYSSLGALSGYTEVGSIYLDGIACTENERAEIDALLKGGVIL